MKPYDKLEEYCLQNKIPFEKNAPLKEHCTFKIGGPAGIIAFPEQEAQIAQLRLLAKSLELPALVLGKGSNVLFSDSGFAGLVICIGSGFSAIRLLDEATIECESGAALTQLCRFALEHGLSGLEFAFGIPGSVGGAVYMNAGAYGGEMKDVLAEAHHIDHKGMPGVLSGEALALDYRRSAYTDQSHIITKAVVRLKPGNPMEVKEKMEDYMNRRRTKQPLELPSAGSVFRRPQGAYASALIDQCGLKGRSVGGAQVSVKHAGFIVNTGGATCSDVLSLIEAVQHEVEQKTGYRLECEVKTIG